MAITDFSVNKLRFWALLSGFEIELVRVQLDYALNTIPTAILSCAIGRDVRTLEAAAIHFAIDTLQVNLPITVMCEASEEANSGVSGGDYPNGPFVVFDGRVVGLGYGKSRSGGASLILYCRHFLMDLEYKLTNTKTTHPKNMGDGGMNAGIVIGLAGPGGGVGLAALGAAATASTPDFVIQSTARRLFTKTNLLDDYWGSALQPWLSDVIDLPAVFEGENINEGQGATEAQDALDRIEPGLDENGDYTFGTPSPMDSQFNVLTFDSAIQAIANDAAQNTFQSFTGTSIWEKLTQEFCSKMHLAVVPMANRALVVPFIPGLRDIWLTIDPSEYEMIRLESYLPRALRGVVIYTGLGSMVGGFGFQKGQAGAIRTVGGKFENENIDPGMFIFREGPVWLNNAVSPAFWAKPALGVDRVKGNMANPGKGDPPRDDVQPKDVRFAAETMWDAFAHSIYLREVLKLRMGSLSGKVRFDISPGSSVEIILTEEKFVGEQVPVAEQSIFGMVTAVSVIYDSDAVTGQTNIAFAYLRDVGENETELGTDNHPLYSTTFAGAPLCEEQP